MEESIVIPNVGDAQELGHASRRFSRPCRHRWHFVGGYRRWGACGWSVVQLDHDEELGPMHGMCGTLDAELEVERTIKWMELSTFLQSSQ